jgi:hypothetical protein
LSPEVGLDAPLRVLARQKASTDMTIHPRTSLLTVPAMLAAAITLTACGSGGGAGTGGSGGGGAACFDPAGFDGMTPPTHFAADVLPILRSSCGVSSTCHGASTPPSAPQHFFGPPMSAGDVGADQIQAILKGIVGQPAVEEPDMDVVKPNDIQNSFILQKLDGLGCPTLECSATASCGLPMPLGLPQLPAAKRDVLRRWIAQGAAND